MLFERIYVHGDRIVDRFRSIGSTTEQLGGVYFVRAMLEAAMKDVNQATKIVTYARPVSVSTAPFPRATWQLTERPGKLDGAPDASNELVLRCDPEPHLGKELDWPKDHECATIARASLPTRRLPQLRVLYDLYIPKCEDTKRLGRFGWTSFHDRKDEVFSALKYESVADNEGLPQFVVMSNRQLPQLLAENKHHFWRSLGEHIGTYEKQHPIPGMLIVAADLLRWADIPVSRQLSWERTAQDFMEAFFTHRHLRGWQAFQHIIVRFGTVGAIYRYNLYGRQQQRLFFDPVAPTYGIYRDVARDGDIIGQQSLFLGSILAQLNRLERGTLTRTDVVQAVIDGIRCAIRRCQYAFTEGLVQGQNVDLGGPEGVWFPKYLAAKPDRHSETERNDGTFSSATIGVETIPIGASSWKILDQSAAYNSLGVALWIVRYGHTEALNNPSFVRKLRSKWFFTDEPVWAPVIEFRAGKRRMVVIDRSEIEAYRSVHNLIRNHIAQCEDNKAGSLPKPLSIAMFGPPGSGKSHCAEVLVEDAGIKINSIVKLNMAEIPPTVEGFHAALTMRLEECSHQSASLVREGKSQIIPMIFFDEFDCRFDGAELGALKYLLPLMEDWNPRLFKFSWSTLSPIFIFAGGTSTNYQDFTREDPSTAREAKVSFASAKGPDFVSRLRGHINVVGVNAVNEYDDSYAMRRAIILRDLLLDKIGGRDNKNINELDDERLSENEKVSTSIIMAMLKVSSYKHGARSMRAIVDMCVRVGGNKVGRYVAASLPTVQQLSMHVNGAEFLQAVRESEIEIDAQPWRFPSIDERSVERHSVEFTI